MIQHQPKATMQNTVLQWCMYLQVQEMKRYYINHTTWLQESKILQRKPREKYIDYILTRIPHFARFMRFQRWSWIITYVLASWAKRNPDIQIPESKWVVSLLFHPLRRTTMQDMSSLLSLFNASAANCLAALCGSFVFLAISTASWLDMTWISRKKWEIDKHV